MKDLKKDARAIENTGKEMARKIDGNESVTDKLGNLGDDVRHGLGNAADEAHEDVNRLARDLERRVQEDDRREPQPSKSR